MKKNYIWKKNSYDWVDSSHCPVSLNNLEDSLDEWDHHKFEFFPSISVDDPRECTGMCLGIQNKDWVSVVRCIEPQKTSHLKIVSHHHRGGQVLDDDGWGAVTYSAYSVGPPSVG